MKYLLLIITILLSRVLAFASDTTIVFRQIEYYKLFDVAKNEHRGVLLYFHFDGCGACRKMEKTSFKNKEVLEYYNKYFVNFEINTKKGDGIEINKKYNIQLHPTFIFFDNLGNELHRIVGVFNPEEFLIQAKNTLMSDKTLTNYKQQYKNGNRSPDFLFDYTYMLRNAHELDSMVVNEYLNAINESDYIHERNIRYMYEFCIHNYKLFIPFNNPRFNFILLNKDKFFKYIDSSQVNTRIVWILNRAANKAIEENDDVLFKKTIGILKDYDNGDPYLFKEIDGRVTGMITSKNLVLSLMLAYYEKSDDHVNYFKTLDTYILKIWNDANELNNFAWDIYERATDKEVEKLENAIKCSKRSIEIENNYANNDTYAWLLYKIGELEESLKQAKRTIAIAMEEKEEYGETQKLIDILEKRK